MIFYFTCTGNTGFIAHQLAQATGERLVSIATAITSGCYEHQLAEDERLGFCFPVHGWRPPFLVRDFIKRLKLKGYSGQYCYAFATCGDDVGKTFDYMSRDLNDIGITLDSAFSLIMPETYNFPFIDQIDTPESARRKIMAARDELAAMIPVIVNRQRGARRINESRWPRINSVVLGAFFLKHWVTDNKFIVDTSVCIGCGKCQQVCPVANIDCTHGNPPRWKHTGRCTTCFACYHHCPAHAINFARRTRGKRQYYFKEEYLK